MSWAHALLKIFLSSNILSPISCTFNVSDSAKFNRFYVVTPSGSLIFIHGSPK